MQVPFVDLKTQGQGLLPEYQAAFTSVVERAAYILGPEVRDFEAAFAEFCACPYALGVSTGTDALLLAYKAAGIGPGDVVAFQLPNWVEAAATFYGASLLGAVLVPVVHFYGAKEVRYILAHTGARALITAASSVPPVSPRSNRIASSASRNCWMMARL